MWVPAVFMGVLLFQSTEVLKFLQKLMVVVVVVNWGALLILWWMKLKNKRQQKMMITWRMRCP